MPWNIAGGVVLLVLGVALAGTHHLWPFVVAGISDGSIYALAALGLVLTYKTSGIFNLAIGAQAAASAYVFYSLRISAGLPWPVAGLLALIAVGLIGSLILERIAYWLSDAPPVMRIVAAIGLMVLLQSLLTGVYGASTLSFPAFLPSGLVTIGGVNVAYSQIIIVALGLASTAGLYVFFRRSRLGVSMQAVVENSNLLGLQGTNPVLVRRYAWAIGSSFVSISGMLLAPALGIDVNQMLVVFIAAFGAAALASFTSLAGAFVAAIAIGIAMNVGSDELSSNHDAIISSLYTQIPFIVLVLALGLLPSRKLVERGAQKVRRFRPVVAFPRRAVVTTSIIGAVVIVLLPHLVGDAYIDQYTTAAGLAVIVMSLGLLLWTSGQISLCHAAFAAVGAVTVGHAQAAGVPWLIALVIAALAALPVGALVAIPSFRLSGTFLAVITFGVGLLFQNLLYNSFLMFGATSQLEVHRPDFGFISSNSDYAYYYVVVTVAAICGLGVVAVRRSRLGRLLRALSDSPIALDAHGADTRRSRLFVFCISASLAAVGGALIAGVTQSATSTSSGIFGYFESLVLVAVLAFCGRQPILSPLAAALLIVVLKLYSPFDKSFFISYQGVIFGALAIAVAVLPGVGALRVGERTKEHVSAGRLRARVELTLEGARR